MLCIESGAYGKRLGKICEVMGLPYEILSFLEDDYVTPSKIESALKGDKSLTLVAMVHCETSSGVVNPVEEVGKIIKTVNPGIAYLLNGSTKCIKQMNISIHGCISKMAYTIHIY